MPPRYESTIAQNVKTYIQKAEPTVLSTSTMTLSPSAGTLATGSPATYTYTASGITQFSISFTNISNSAKNDPTLASQQQRFRVNITMPFAIVNWNSFGLIKMGAPTNMQAEVDWYSLKDVPVVITTVLPAD